MKKSAAVLLLTAAFMFIMHSAAFALVRSEADIRIKANILQKMADYDYLNLINKSELIGSSRQNFNMSAQQYKNDAKLAQENMLKIISQIQSTRALNEDYMSSSDKNMQINRLYQDADSILYDMNNKAVNHLYSISGYMPSMTYQKYAKKFSSFYNAFNLTEVKIEVK